MTESNCVVTKSDYVVTKSDWVVTVPDWWSSVAPTRPGSSAGQEWELSGVQLVIYSLLLVIESII